MAKWLKSSVACPWFLAQILLMPVSEGVPSVHATVNRCLIGMADESVVARRNAIHITSSCTAVKRLVCFKSAQCQT